MVNWRNLAIGTKVMGVTVLTVGVLLGAGAYFLGQKMQGDLVELLTGRASVIQKQIEVTRAYISSQYVAKAKENGFSGFFFISNVPLLRNFCIKRLGFQDYGDDFLGKLFIDKPKEDMI